MGMDVVFNPKSGIVLSGTADEDCSGTIKLQNNENHDIKYKIRTTLPSRVVLSPQTAVIEAKGSKTVKIQYKSSADEVKEPKLMFRVYLLSLKEISDCDNVFAENESLTEQRIFQAAFMVKPDDDDAMFLSPMASKESRVEDDLDFTGKATKNIRWLKK